jgi:hypothetical protein
MVRKLVLVLLLAGGLVVVAASALIVSSLSYDRFDPRDRPNSYMSVESAVVERPVEDVFRFVQYGIPGIYTRMSPMHERFDIVNAAGLVFGAEVDCVEGDDRQQVRNHYVVTEVVTNERIVMESRPTRVYDRSSGRQLAEVEVWTYFDFERLDGGRTRLTQTVVLDMGSPVYKSLADLVAFVTGTRNDWERQFSEELATLAAFAAAAEPIGPPTDDTGS